ncbi:MAG: energy transducer TonB [Verrucomicrobium sp.]|nr:energy transducer TonB [Verrucomicrobium sp.]
MTDAFLRRAGWGVSLAAHLLLFCGAGLWMVRHPVYSVRSAPTSAEVDLVAAPEPVPPPTPENEMPSAERPAPPPPRMKEAARASRGVRQAAPDYASNPPPVYPEAARRARQQGTVLLTVWVDEKGGVKEAAVCCSSGFPLLDGAALKAVRAWKFQPAVLGGLAVSDRVNVPVRFVLRG